MVAAVPTVETERLVLRPWRAGEDLDALAALRQVNLAGVIVGKALYEGRLTVADGQAALEGAGHGLS